MNSQLIEKIITANNLSCPSFSYQNPVLDKNVAKTLAKSFVKILNLSKQNSKVNNNLRLNILENIRKLCQIEPENHLKINEEVSSLLTELYEEKIKKSTNFKKSDSVDRLLDKFLIENTKEININSNYQPTLKPDSVQALINLNQNDFFLELLLEDVILWNCNDNKTQVLKNLWNDETTLSKSIITEHISVKMKSEIERILIESCSLLKEKNTEEIMTINNIKNLIIKCSKSANCFQMCSSILNHLFIISNFSKDIENFIRLFIINVKNLSQQQFYNLYSFDLSHIVILVDIDLTELPINIKLSYIQSGLQYLQELRTKSENDFIMLLSHFPQWFDIYFEQTMSCEY